MIPALSVKKKTKDVARNWKKNKFQTKKQKLLYRGFLFS